MADKRVKKNLMKVQAILRPFHERPSRALKGNSLAFTLRYCKVWIEGMTRVSFKGFLLAPVERKYNAVVPVRETMK